ncbi:30S ribosomal protein S4e [Candidatus Woesearchaeota archaeon]|nr:30S ribosomal protein S4e [Candidatus Woesearchaeota archaeon]
MVKNHLKRIAAPKTWNIERKESTWITRPNSGAHSFLLGLSLDTVMRDMTKVAKTASEANFIVKTKDVLVDKKRRRDRRFNVGIMDLVEFPAIEESYRILLDEKGRLTAVRVSDGENTTKLSRIERKTKISGGKTQLTLSDGRNIILSKDAYHVGDSLQLELPSQKILHHYPLGKGATVYLLFGKHAGKIGTVEEINKGKLIFSAHGEKREKYETLACYAFPVGAEKPALPCLTKKDLN